jgi:hypothetical protein
VFFDLLVLQKNSILVQALNLRQHVKSEICFMRFVVLFCVLVPGETISGSFEPSISATPSEPTTAEATKASTAAEPATTEAIPPKSTAASEAITSKSTTAETIKTAALKALEPLARKVTTRPVLSLVVQPTASAPGPIETVCA